MNSIDQIAAETVESLFGSTRDITDKRIAAEIIKSSIEKATRLLLDEATRELIAQRNHRR